jgi:hypothetical protein
LTFALYGCADPLGQRWQQEWRRNKITWAGNTVSELDTRGSPQLSKETLLAMLPSPDFEVTPEKFEEMLINDVQSRAMVMSRLWHEYRSKKYRDWKTGRLQTTTEPVEGSWRESPDFMKTSLWVYNERTHFSHALPHDPLFAPGFYVNCFFVEDSGVVGVTSFICGSPAQKHRGNMFLVWRQQTDVGSADGR